MLKHNATVLKIKTTGILFALIFLTVHVCISQDSSKAARSRNDLTFFGDGNISKSIDDADNIPANTGLGVNFIQRWDTIKGRKFYLNAFDKMELEASINVASSVDTLVAEYDSLCVLNSSDFGTAILTPLNFGQAVRIWLRFDFAKVRHPGNPIDFIKASYVGSNRNWLVNDGTASKIIKGTSNNKAGRLFEVRLGYYFQPARSKGRLQF